MMIQSGLYLIVNTARTFSESTKGKSAHEDDAFDIPLGALKVGMREVDIDKYSEFYERWCGGPVQFEVLFRHEDTRVLKKLEKEFHRRFHEYRIKRRSGRGKPKEWMTGITDGQARKGFKTILGDMGLGG